ncbi:uncharacterized protein LOC116953422 isoform X2 [Petromyzon marinus]|uniref:Bcl-2-associated transcription factor 1-like isoform X2 n=1 Tax=Petromyzon marinus TaxID=7757 RepID=A0AAJ7XCB9_PETMA|nr:bcl-2-associated transcription factor 1-like isoform X2 [Petromyzon marinus]
MPRSRSKSRSSRSRSGSRSWSNSRKKKHRSRSRSYSSDREHKHYHHYQEHHYGRGRFPRRPFQPGRGRGFGRGAPRLFRGQNMFRLPSSRSYHYHSRSRSRSRSPRYHRSHDRKQRSSSPPPKMPVPQKKQQLQQHQLQQQQQQQQPPQQARGRSSPDVATKGQPGAPTKHRKKSERHSERVKGTKGRIVHEKPLTVEPAEEFPTHKEALDEGYGEEGGLEAFEASGDFEQRGRLALASAKSKARWQVSAGRERAGARGDGAEQGPPGSAAAASPNRNPERRHRRRHRPTTPDRGRDGPRGHGAEGSAEKADIVTRSPLRCSLDGVGLSGLSVGRAEKSPPFPKRTSCLFPSDRQLSVDLVKARKKKDSKKKKKGEEKEFRSIFDHIQHDTAKLREKSPVETFAQHIVSLVHHVKERKFKPSDVTLSERFARAQEEAGEETRKKKKSPEIHRRIDISPRTIKPRTHTDAHSRESSPGAEEEMNRNPEDLRYDLERRRKERSDEPEYWREGSEEHHNYRPRERSRSYSPGNELHDHHDPHEPHEPHQPPYGPGGFDKSRLGNKPYFFNRGNFRARPPFHYRGQFRGQYRGRGNYYNNNYNNSNYGGGGGYHSGGHHSEGYNEGHGGGGGGGPPPYGGPGWGSGSGAGWSGQGTHGYQTFPQRRPPEEEWDPEYTPKSKKYFLHDDRDEREEDGHWGRRPRARGFFPRGARGRPWHRPGDSPVWTHDKYEVSDDEDDNNDNEGAGGTSDAPSDAAATTTTTSGGGAPDKEQQPSESMDK